MTLAFVIAMTIRSYNSEFMAYAARSSAYSAAVIASILQKQLGIRSVLDVGCAKGTWLRIWSDLGVSDVHGIDGDYVDRRTLEIPAPAFTAQNLNLTFDLRRQFDLVQSLEVGEHVEKAASGVFVDNIARHAGRCVLFSAAPPGQGGEHHVNEQPYEFWRQMFEQRGFATLDVVRPFIAGDSKISYWYRYNTLLFVRRELLPEIGTVWQSRALSSGEQIKDISPLLFRIRKALVRMLPKPVQHEIARLKAKVLPTGRI